MNNAALISIIIFIAVYALIIFNLLPRSIITLAGAILLLLLGIVKDSQLVSVINWDAMGLILGMFILVRVLVESGFFDVLSSWILKITNGVPALIFIAFSLAPGILAAFMDSITVMLFMGSLSIDISKKLNVDPASFILAEICAANIGGSSTLMGDPPNVILGTGLGITLTQFVTRLAPISLLVLILNTVLFFYKNRTTFSKAKKLDKDYIEQLRPLEQAKDRYMLVTGALSFIFTIVLLVLHQEIGLEVGYVGLIGATIALVLNGKRVSDIWGKIDWEVIVFFATLFIVIGALTETGVIASLASLITAVASNSSVILKNIILWTSGILSGFIDNVPFAASMVPLIKTLSGKVILSTLSMGLIAAFGTDVGGNFTPIGASANVVGLAILKSTGEEEISWGKYIRDVAPITFIELVVADVLFLLLYH
jgi:Na+/H+ antiporter NhaD/arsenite permease-like protein